MISLKQIRFEVPAEDLDEFYAYPDAERKKVLQLFDSFRLIASAKTIRHGLRAAVLDPSCKISAKRLGDLYRDYRKSGDWRDLLPRWNNGNKALPSAFLQHWKALCERNQRKCKPAYKTLLSDWVRWRAGDASVRIPGYRLPPPPCPHTGVPRGWSYQHLMRHRPQTYELVAARIGRAKAMDTFRPKVITTRAELEVGQYILFDDVEHDLVTNVMGQAKATRPLEFNMIDLFSAYKPVWIIKPTLIDIKGKKTKLKEREMLYLTMAYLTGFGYRQDGTSLIVEHGTSAIPEYLAQILYDHSGGSITVERSGMQGAPAFAGLDRGPAKGNPRFKAALESYHNLLHNSMAAIPGQVGKDRYHSPEPMSGQQMRNNRYLAALHALAESGSFEAVNNLRLDFLEFSQFCQIASAVYDKINVDTDHHLEGWKEAGLHVAEYRLEQKAPWAIVPNNDRARMIREYCAGQDGLIRHRRMSRQEAWRMGANKLKKMSLAPAAAILREKVAVERTVNNQGCIEFEDGEYRSGHYVFLGQITASDGTERHLTRGEKFDTVWNPLRPDELHVFSAKGAYIGSCPGWDRPSRDDTDAVYRSIGKARAAESQMLAGLAFRGREILKQNLQNTETNINLLDPAQRQRVKASQSKAQAANRATDEDADDLLTVQQSVSYEPAPEEYEDDPF